MATGAIAGIGTKLQIGDGGSPESFTTIAEVTEISGPSLGADTADVTSHDSELNEGGFEEHIVTILRTGEVTFTINYIPTDGTHDASSGLLNDYQNKTLRNFKLVFPDSSNTTWSFSAYVTGFEPSTSPSDQYDASVTLKPSGEPTLN